MKSFPIAPLALCFKSLSVLVGMALLTPHAKGATIMDWGGKKYVTSYAGIAGTASTSGGSSTWLYSMATKKSPDASVYTGPAFYGAFSLTDSAGTGAPQFRDGYFGVNSGATVDSLRFSTVTPAGSSITMRGLLFFKKEDFLGVASSGTVTFDETSSLTLQLGTSIGANPRTVKMAVYALVDGVWSWYLSSASTASAATPFSISNPGAANWGLYSIGEATAPLNAHPGASNYTTLGSQFEDIGAVGVFFNYFETTANANTSVYLNTFTVDAHVTAVPEPSVAALLLGGIAMAAAARRLKGKR